MGEGQLLAPGSIVIAGVHVDSDGYPNVRARVRALRAVAGGAPELVCPFRAPGFERVNAGSWKPWRLLVAGGRLLYCHARVLWLIARRARGRVVYVPYPAVLLVFCLGLLPRRLRPRRVVADAFISLYDTVVNDRRLLAPKGLAGRLLRRIEAAAYAHADLVLVDTPQNAAYFAATFGTALDRLLTLPLAIDETAYRPAPYAARPATAVRVLFIGTFVPLQGVETIVRAAQRLRDRTDVEFTLIGDGQDGARVAGLLREVPHARVTWIRDWQSPTALARRIVEADLCLGIFGTSGKSDRVWPLKNYAYMAVGRAIITGDTACARTVVGAATPAALLVPPGNPEALADAIIHLATRPTERTALAATALAVYQQRLSNAAGMDVLTPRLAALCAPATP